MSLAKPTLQSTPRHVRYETPNLYVRTLTTDDASDRWAAWFDQAEIQEALNIAPRKRTKADIVTYIKTFDQDKDLLLGIFDRTNDLLVGLVTAHIDWTIGRYLANTVVGEAEYRHRGAMLEISPGFRSYFFDELGLNVMTATALATNKPIIGYLEKTGWTCNQVLKNQARSTKDGTPIDLHLYSITREAWNAWKAANPELLAAMLKGTLR